MERVCIIGLEDEQVEELRARLEAPIIGHVSLPRILVEDGMLFVERRNGAGFLPVSHVIFHSIYADDADFIAGLALWGGPCLPNARAMMDCRLKLPCLVRALALTRFGALARGFLWPGATFTTVTPHVAKWGNWHCGENKARFERIWQSDEACLIEPFVEGESVRLAVIGDRFWQIRLTGSDWRKSIHGENAAFMDVDPELLADTQAVQSGFGLEVIANDYVVTAAGERHLLEVNHIPNVDQFAEMWDAYRDFAVQWIGKGR